MMTETGGRQGDWWFLIFLILISQIFFAVQDTSLDLPLNLIQGQRKIDESFYFNHCNEGDPLDSLLMYQEYP